MEFIKNWVSGVIVAVIIATLIEMLLPENKNKKYIKTVIGVYVLFTIISPIISNAIPNGNLDVSKYENYFKTGESYNNLATNFEIDNADNIEKIYKEQIKADIKTKLENKGFDSKIINLEIITEKEDEYGALKSIELMVATKTEEENKTTNEIHIDKIEIGNTVELKEESKANITQEQIYEIKEYLQEEYGIKKENIKIH